MKQNIFILLIISVFIGGGDMSPPACNTSTHHYMSSPLYLHPPSRTYHCAPPPEVNSPFHGAYKWQYNDDKVEKQLGEWRFAYGKLNQDGFTTLQVGNRRGAVNPQEVGHRYIFTPIAWTLENRHWVIAGKFAICSRGVPP